jgi:phospholipase/lecithinase/hemolysin
MAPVPMRPGGENFVISRVRSFSKVLLAASALGAVAAPASAQRIDNIVAFGDSYADSGNAIELLLASPFVSQATKDQLRLVYPTGRFSGGTNYVDTLSQLLNAPVDNFAIGGALTNNVNTNGPILPGFTTEYNLFLNGGGGVFPTSTGTFDEHDLVTVSVGGNDARFYQQNNGLLDGAAAAGSASAGFATTGLDALVGAGAQTISFLAGNTAILPEVADDPEAMEIRNTYSTSFNNQIQSVLAGYAADGVTVHYLDLTAVGQQIIADPAAYGLTSGGVCAPAPSCIASSSYTNQFLFYVDNLHLTSAGFAIIARYIATQLQAPLTLEAPSETGLETAREFGRILNGRMDVAAPRDGGLAEGLSLFVVGDTVSREVDADDRTDSFDIDGVGGTAGLTYGFGNGVVGLAGNYSRPRARFGANVARDEIDSYQVGAFGGYAIAGAFVQGHVGYGRDKHEIERQGVVEDLRASPDGDHWLAGAKAGYLLPVGIFRIGPVAALDYARAKVDGYTESGDPALNLNVDTVTAKSLTGSLGAELRGDFDNNGIQLRPFASAVAEMDFIGDGRTVYYAQTASPGIVNHWSFEDRSKDPYARLTGGASAAIFDRLTLDALASGTLGREQGDDVSAQVGLRLAL